MCALYRPPDGDVDNALTQLDEDVMGITENVECELVFLGDVNIDTLKSRTTTCQKYKDFLKQHSLSSLISIPTHISQQEQLNSCIDHIVVNRTDYFVKSGVMCLSLSDHLPVYCFRKRADIVKDFRFLETRSYRRFSEEVFAAAIDQFDWSPCLSSNDVDWCWNFFRNSFINILNQMAPMRRMRFDQNLPEWMTSKCLSLMKRRDILDAKYRKRPNDQNRMLYHQVRNQVTNMKVNLKRAFFATAIEDSRGD